MQCPHCTSREIRYSRRGNAALPWVVRLFIVCLRCRLCGRRFHGRGALLGGSTFRNNDNSRTKEPFRRAA